METKENTKEPEEVFTYKYYLIGNVNLVRVEIDAKGRPANAENPDDENPGKLKIRTTLLSVIFFKDEEDVEKITKEQFEARCEEIWAQKKL